MAQTSNSHLTDPHLPPFLNPSFSPVSYLNTHLPSPSPNKTSQTPASLTTLASQTQSHVSVLSAQSARLSTTLTTITDNILRTSSRLAYEVELLRGEAVSLAETLSSNGDLHESILKIVPGGLAGTSTSSDTPLSPSNAKNGEQDEHYTEESTKREPPSLPHLRTLLHVRRQLQSTIQTFNQALSFPFPPSLLTTTTSSLITVSAVNQDPDLESKGQVALSRLKHEVMERMADEGGLEKARARVQELKDLCSVWKGTGEERARNKWIEGLDGEVEEEARRREGSRKGNDGSAVRGIAESGGGATGPGFLRRLREEIYLE